MSSPPEQQRRARIRASALWAAYGDALGFMTELADSKMVARRGVQLPVVKPVAWRRRIGGRFGPTVDLPAGCISDDTQLRLATSRSIGADGRFDPETFAKIELPVWTSYALGAGRGSQEAAANLRRQNVTWATNFFAADRSMYVNGGGNGAAMRIQPHVWCSGKRDTGTWRTDVIINAISTHGHMRGILGALFHAACLRSALERSAVPGPADWMEISEQLVDAIRIIGAHDHLQNLWLGLWEQHSETTLAEACDSVFFELRNDIKAIAKIGSGAGGYNDAVEAVGAYRPAERGSGIKTALLAAVVAHLLQDDPRQVVQVPANRLGTDTDSIATMAGALIGATLTDGPDVPLLDRDYIQHEADRMWAIGEGLQVPNFPYPSLVSWAAPHNQVESLGAVDNGLAVAGLGPVIRHEEVAAASGKNASAWSWVDVWFGQRLLIKQRPHPTGLQPSQLVSTTTRYANASLLDELPATGAPPKPTPTHVAQAAAESEAARQREAAPIRRPRTLHVITDEVINSDFDPVVVGRALLELADREDGIELAGQFAAIIAKARLTRQDRNRRR